MLCYVILFYFTLFVCTAHLFVFVVCDTCVFVFLLVTFAAVYLASEGVVSLGVTLSRCVCVRRAPAKICTPVRVLLVFIVILPYYIVNKND